MDARQYFDLINGSGPQNVMSQNTNTSSPARPSSSADRRQQLRRPSQTAGPQPKRPRTEALVQPQPPRQAAQNPTFHPAFNNVNGAGTGREQRPHLYHFEAKLTRIWLSEQEYQSVARCLEPIPEKLPLVQVMASMAEKMVPVRIPVPMPVPRQRNILFPTQPPYFRAVAEDMGSSPDTEPGRTVVDLRKLRVPKPEEEDIDLSL